MTLETSVAQTTREAPPVPMRGPNTQAWTPPGASCLRCGGLLASSYTESLERDIIGELVRQWRCVNCGDCLDSIILANRWKSPVPACETADQHAAIVCRQPVMTGVLEVRVPKANEGKKTAITVKINRVLVS
jgi:ferredoxin